VGSRPNWIGNNTLQSCAVLCDNQENLLNLNSTAGLLFAEFFECILLKLLVHTARNGAAFHVLQCLGRREV
jgi:hypothetical protein